MQHSPSVQLLGTGYVKLRNAFGTHIYAKALFDNGSQANVITLRLADQLKIKMDPLRVTFSGINSSKLRDTMTFSTSIYAWDDDANANGVTATLIANETLPTLTPYHFHNKVPEFERLRLSDPDYNIDEPIDLLLGIGVWGNIVKSHVLESQCGLKAQNTRFGYVVFGTMHCAPAQISDKFTIGFTAISTGNAHDDILDMLLSRLYELNEPMDTKQTVAEQRAEQLFVDTTYRNADGRFVVRIPFIDDKPVLGNSRINALKRLLYLEKRFTREPELKYKYSEFMTEFLKSGHMRKANKSDLASEDGYYMPHHSVQKRFRVVFDASAITSNGKSLNDVQLAGPNLQEHLAIIITRFRIHRYVFSTDVKKMFRQFLINPDDQRYQKLLWRSNSDEPICEYVLQTVTYGMKASPFLAMRCMIELAKIHKTDFPLASHATLYERYMDDYFSGQNAEPDVIKLYEQLRSMLSNAGLELGKWQTNSNLLKHRLEADAFQLNDSTEVNDGYASVLGLTWNTNSDAFQFKIWPIENPDDVLTKRIVVGDLGRLYDPNGYLGPVTVKARMFVQHLWTQQINWDDALSHKDHLQWRKLQSELLVLNELKIPRWLLTTPNAEMELVGFADASSKAYGACIYLRIKTDNAFECQLIMSESHVAPIKELTIPRLELLAVECLARIAQIISVKCFNANIKYTLFTDSMIVLQWLAKDASTFKQWVSRRIANVQKLSEFKHWNHVATAENPADLLSRGSSPENLLNNELWWNGPQFLKQEKENWNCKQIQVASAESIAGREEYKTDMKLSVLCVKIAKEKRHSCLTIDRSLLIDYCSSLGKLARVTSYCRRVLLIYKQKYKPDDSLKQCDLSTILIQKSELLWSLDYWIRFTQDTAFRSDIKRIKEIGEADHKSTLIRLKPIVDKNGILRVWGRIDNAFLPQDEKHPIIIPSHSRFGKLLMLEAHHRTMHGGVQMMLHYVRVRYWVLQSRKAARNVVRSCVQCIRFNQKEHDQIMADLPKERLIAAAPFTYCGVDHFGPVHLKRFEGRCNTIIAGYVAVFVCMTTRMVHMECCTGLTAERFIWAFTRFTSIYGMPQRMFSDNGTTFIGAETILRKARESWSDLKTLDHLNQHGITWQHITPRSPNQGGLWEAVVKSGKHHIRRVSMARAFTFEQYQTMLAGVSAILNSRPIAPLSDDPHDLNYLTPSRAFMGKRIVQPLIANERLIPLEHTRMNAAVDTMIRQFWADFQKDYFHSLQCRPKWNTSKRNLKANDVVLLMETRSAPQNWLLGRVIKTFAGSDGRVRNVRVRTHTGEFERSVRALVLLPTTEELEEEQKAQYHKGNERLSLNHIQSTPQSEESADSSKASTPQPEEGSPTKRRSMRTRSKGSPEQ